MEEQVKDKRSAIMGAALKLFTQKGFHGTSTALISKEAGVATGTLFNYFPTKEDLINNLYFEVKGRLSVCMKQGLDSEKSFESRLELVWGNLIRCCVSNPDEFNFIGQFSSSPYISKITREEAMKEYGFITDLAEEGISSGQLAGECVELSMMMFYQASRAAVTFILESGQDMETVIEEGFSFLWNGMAGY